MNIEPLHPEFGARISGVDLCQALDQSNFEQIDAAINRYSFLLFENQQMNDDAHLEFTRRFGELEEEHVSYYSRGEVTYIGRVGNIDDEGNKVSARQIKASTGNEMWHQRLDPATRQRIEGKVGIHDYIYSRTKVGEDAVNQGQRTYMHPVRQRLVRQNPVTGERNVFVGSHVKEIEGMPDAEAKPLIKRLIAEVTRPESVYRHRWQVGDFAIWDNRCLLHSGCGYDADKYRRRMHQTRVRGQAPSIAEPLN